MNVKRVYTNGMFEELFAMHFINRSNPQYIGLNLHKADPQFILETGERMMNTKKNSPSSGLSLY